MILGIDMYESPARDLGCSQPFCWTIAVGTLLQKSWTIAQFSNSMFS